jgi:hypothetical protein
MANRAFFILGPSREAAPWLLTNHPTCHRFSHFNYHHKSSTTAKNWLIAVLYG